MSRRPLLRSFGLLLSLGVAGVAAVAGCADVGGYGTCVDDAVCGDGTVCAFGLCVDANDPRLATVDLEIEPVSSSGLPTQALFDVDAAAAAGARVNVTLQDAVTMESRVQDLAGQPVAAAVLARPSASIPGRLRLPTTVTDDNGTFALSVVDDGSRYALSVVPEDRTTYPPQELTSVDPRDDLPSVVIDQTTFTRLRGRIIAGTGVGAQPIDGQEVKVVVDGQRISTVATTVNGAFDIALRDVIPAGATLELQSVVECGGVPSLSIPLDVEAGGDIDLGDISLGPAVTQVEVAGTVTDDNGAPVSGALVTFRGLIGAGSYACANTAGDDGSFTFRQLIPGSYSVAVVPPQTSTAGLLVQDVVIDRGSVVSVVLPSRVAVAVAVTTADGVAMSGGSVSFQRVGDVFGIAEPVLESAQPVFATSTDVDGGAALRIDQGRYRVSIQPPRDSGAPSFSTLVTVDGPFTPAFVLPPQSVLAGVVVDAAGAPAPGAIVRVFSHVTDEQGRAIFLGEAVCAPDGSFAVSVPDLSPPVDAVGDL